MKFKIKPNTYYKDYSYKNTVTEYDIIYTDDIDYYLIAFKHKGFPLTTPHKNCYIGTIKEWNYIIELNSYYDMITEITEGDLFLELL